MPETAAPQLPEIALICYSQCKQPWQGRCKFTRAHRGQQMHVCVPVHRPSFRNFNRQLRHCICRENGEQLLQNVSDGAVRMLQLLSIGANGTLDLLQISGYARTQYPSQREGYGKLANWICSTNEVVTTTTMANKLSGSALTCVPTACFGSSLAHYMRVITVRVEIKGFSGIHGSKLPS